MTPRYAMPYSVGMTRTQAISYYGTQAAVGRAIGLGRAAVNGWGEEIPWHWQCALEVASGGALKADPPPGARQKGGKRQAA